MRLVVDANVLVGELTRRRGQDLIAHASLDLAIAERAWDEALHELRRRIGSGYVCSAMTAFANSRSSSSLL